MVDNLLKFFRKTNTPQEITNCIIAGLNSWLQGQEPSMIESIAPWTSRHLKESYQEQKDIGWGHFLRGRISIVWAKFINFEIRQQQREGRKKKFRFKSAESWGTKIILIMWPHINNMWEERNKAVRLKYKKIGKSQDHEFMKAKALQEMEEITEMDDSDSKMVQKDPVEIEGMHPLSLLVFVKNLHKVKKRIWKK